MDPITQIVADGETAIDSFLEQSARLSATIATTFPSVSLEAVAQEFAKAPINPKAVNEKVTAISTLLREEAGAAVDAFRRAEMWLSMKAPAVSDGNNFGVDVQNYVADEMKKMREVMEAMSTTVKDYHWGRASGLEKIAGDEKQESSSSKTDETDEEKKTSKTSNTTKSTTTKPEPYADYTAYLVSVDVKQYHQVFGQLTVVRNNYVKAHQLFNKNMKRLSDPRGEGENGQSVHTMSMF